MLYIHYVRYTCIMGAHCDFQVTKNGNIGLPTIGWGGTAAMRQKSADAYTTGQNNLLHLQTSYLRLFQCAPGVSRSKIQPNPYWCGSSDPLQTWIAITVMHVKKFNLSKKREIQNKDDSFTKQLVVWTMELIIGERLLSNCYPC